MAASGAYSLRLTAALATAAAGSSGQFYSSSCRQALLAFDHVSASRRCAHSTPEQQAASGDTQHGQQKQSDTAKQQSSPASVRISYDPDKPLKDPSKRGAPFVPPSVDKLIRVIMRHGEKEKARKIVFDTSHAMYNMTRSANPRPELKQRVKQFVKR